MNTTVNKSVPQSSINETWSYIAEPSASLVFRVFIFVLIMLASVLGNAVVCRAMALLPYRQLPFSYYLVTNLAAAEILSSLCYPFYFVYDWLEYWPFGEVACKLVFPIQMTATIVVTYTLALIAAHRYRVIVTYHSQLGPLPRTKVMLVLSLLWSAALIIVVPAGVEHRLIRPKTDYYCVALFPGDTHNHAPTHIKYTIVRQILSYVVPYLIIVISYGAVALKLKKHMATATASRKSDVTEDKTLLATGHPEGIALEELKGDISAVQKNERKSNEKYSIAKITSGSRTRRGSHDARSTVQTTNTANHCQDADVTDLELDILRMIYVIIIIFVVCYIPIQVWFIYELVNGGPAAWPYYPTARRYVFLLHCLPGAFHPILYGTMSKFYAKAFAKLVLCK